MTEPSSQDSSARTFLNEKMGPFPVWIWLALGLGLIVILQYMKNRNNPATSTTTPSTSVSDSQIPQFVNQTYTTVTPPQVTVPITNQIPTPTGQPEPPENPTPAPPPVAAPIQKAGLHDPRAVSQYFLVHDTKNNKWYYVNFNEHSSFTLTPQAAAGNLKFKPTVVNSTKVPVFKGDQLRYV